MTPERFKQIEDLYYAVSEKSTEERAAFLAQVDPELRSEVESLLIERSGVEFLEHAAVKDVPQLHNSTAATLSPGICLGPYRIERKLGKGGMGEVFRGVDTRLGRAVAIKVTHEQFSGRFEREARVISVLNHPNICTLYDVGPNYLVMELIEGESLAAAIRNGPLGFETASRYGQQIAAALAAAHAAGIVHRDIKPGNIMINRAGMVKVLDFGLARQTNFGPNNETATLTAEGIISGTIGYMSPEQAEGKPLDARSDIFSFGALLYEMLTGRRAFSGASGVATLAAVIKDDPVPIRSIAPDIPAEMERIVSHCLRKDPAQRSQSMPEVLMEIQDLRDEISSGNHIASTEHAARAKKRHRFAVYFGCALLVLGAGVWLSARFLLRTTEQTPTVVTSFVGEHGNPTLAPDGNQFAFSWDGDVPNGKPHIYASLIGKVSPLRLTPEEESAIEPAWSPDSQSIAYVRQTGPRRSDLVVMTSLGGAARVVGSGWIDGPTWSPDSRWLLYIQIDESRFSGIWIVPAAGGEPRRLLPKGNYKGDEGPAISPDGRHIVFVRVAADFDSDLYVADLEGGQISGDPHMLTSDHHTKVNPIWVADGRELLYVSGDSKDESFVYRISATGGHPRRMESLRGKAIDNLTFSPHAKRLLYSTVSINYDIERLALGVKQAKAERFLSSTRFESTPAYSPDGKRIAFMSNRSGVMQIWVANADGSSPVALTSFESGMAGSPQWSPDGLMLAFDARPGLAADIYTIPASGGTAKRLTDYPGEDHVPSWSPDGKWIYFGSRRAGGHEVFRMHPDGSDVQQITHDGGLSGMVSPDGKWLYYTASGKGLWKMPADGGEPTQVLTRMQANGTLSFTLDREGIYANGRDGAGGFPIVFFPFNNQPPKTLTVLNRAPYLNPAVSPDHSYLLYTVNDDPVYGIMAIDNFR